MKKFGWIGLLLLTVALAVPVAAVEEDAPAHTHNVASWTATQMGHRGVCTDCGETVDAEHSYGEGIETLKPGCTAAGEKTYTCVCGHTKTEPIPETGHSYGKWATGNASQHQRTCANCGETDSTGHNWNSGEITLWPYCTWEGERTYYCRDCGRKKIEKIPMIDHLFENSCDISCGRCGLIRRTKHQYETQWSGDEKEHWYACTVCGDKGDLDVHFAGPWIIDKEAEEFQDGQRHNECVTCGRVVQTEVIPATGCLHGNEQLRDELAPTCTTEGYTGNWRCPRCNEVVIPGEPIPVHPHDTVLENQKDATCTEEGYTGDEICRGCLGVIVEGQIIEKLPHETVLENQKEATCTEEGYTGDEICRGCLGVIVEGQIIEKLPHETVLGNQKDATCTEEGHTGDHICVNCQTVVTAGEVVAMLPHETTLNNQKDATCTAAGYTGDRICVNCQMLMEQGSQIPAKAHRFEGGVCLDCQGRDPDWQEPGEDQDLDADREEPLKMSPLVIGSIVALGLASAGMAAMLFLLLKKK